MLSASQTVWKRHRFLPRICVTVQQTDENEPFYGLLIESRCTGFIKIFMVGGTGCLRGLVMGWVSYLFAASHPAPGRSNWKQMSEPSPVGCVASAGGSWWALCCFIRGHCTLESSEHPWESCFHGTRWGTWVKEGQKEFFHPFVGRKQSFLSFFFLFFSTLFVSLCQLNLSVGGLCQRSFSRRAVGSQKGNNFRNTTSEISVFAGWCIKAVSWGLPWRRTRVLIYALASNDDLAVLKHYLRWAPMPILPWW